MWCKHCGQDVPAIARGGQGQFGCPRCGATTAAESPFAVTHAVGLVESADFGLDLSASARKAGVETPALDDWELEEDLRKLRRMLHTTGDLSADFSVREEQPRRADAAHVRPLNQLNQQPVSAARGALERETPQRRGGSIAWLMSWLGLTACVCGVSLLGWSLAAGRSDAWNLGLPITLGGQFGLLCGLIMQLDRIRHDNSQAAEKLGHVDERLIELKQTAALLSTANGSAAGGFYSHLAEGASPQLLLADLKGQLDLLAVRLATTR